MPTGQTEPAALHRPLAVPLPRHVEGPRSHIDAAYEASTTYLAEHAMAVIPPKLVRRLLIAPARGPRRGGARPALAGPAPARAARLAVHGRPAAASALRWRSSSPARRHHVAAIARLPRPVDRSGLRPRGSDSERMQHAHYARHALVRARASTARSSRSRTSSVEAIDSDAARSVLSGTTARCSLLGRHAGEGDTLLVIHELLCRAPPRAEHRHARALPARPAHRRPGRAPPEPLRRPARRRHRAATSPSMATTLGDDGRARDLPRGPELLRGAPPARRSSGSSEAGHHAQAEAARAMQHVSAPRPGGALAAIEAAPRGRRRHPRPRRLPDRPEARSGASCPSRRPSRSACGTSPPTRSRADRDAQIDWLYGWWETLDAWVSERESAAPAA